MKHIKSSVELIAATQLINSELNPEWMPVLAARVSHGQDAKTGQDHAKDEGLLKFLAQHNHTSPFEHLNATFKITCPLFIRSEWHRHRTQSYNEISMRYTSDYVGQVWFPDGWRAQDNKNRQVGLGDLDEVNSKQAESVLSEAYLFALKSYDTLLSLGVCREQARAVIPVGHATHFYASANLLNWARFCKLRSTPQAQLEIRELSDAIDKQLMELYPTPWKYLSEYIVHG